MPILIRGLTVAALGLGLAVGAPAVALASPSAAPSAPTATAAAPAPAPAVAPKRTKKAIKKCAKIVKLKSGKKVKRWVACKPSKAKVKKVAADKAAVASSSASCKAMAHSIAARFGVPALTGARPGNPSSDHNRGQAWDLMVTGPKGDAIADAAAASPLTKYVIWKAPDHWNHVHISCF